jgi:hypothetical protein
MVNAFGGGDYLVWTISGHVLFRVTNLSGPSSNAVVSAVFFGTGSAPQLAARGQGPGRQGLPPLTEPALLTILEAAEERWIATGLSAAQVQQLRGVTAVVTDLHDGDLGRATVGGSVLYLDVNGAGYGWYIDPTPLDDGEFPLVTRTGLHAMAGSPATGRMDLLTVVMHELGHVLGLDSVYSGDPADLMAAFLDTGDRRLPSYPALGLGQSATAAEATAGVRSQASRLPAVDASLAAAGTARPFAAAETSVLMPDKSEIELSRWAIPDWWFMSEGLGRTRRRRPWESDEGAFAA